MFYTAQWCDFLQRADESVSEEVSKNRLLIKKTNQIIHKKESIEESIIKQVMRLCGLNSKLNNK